MSKKSAIKRTAKLLEGSDPLGPPTRQKRLEIRFHNHEFQQLVLYFENQDKFQNLAQMIRETMLTITEPVEEKISRQKMFDEVMNTQEEIRRLGININQIARQVNSGDPVAQYTQELQDAFKKISTLNASLLKKVYGAKK